MNIISKKFALTRNLFGRVVGWFKFSHLLRFKLFSPTSGDLKSLKRHFWAGGPFKFSLAAFVKGGSKDTDSGFKVTDTRQHMLNYIKPDICHK